MKVTLIGSLPPHRGISPYLEHLATALAARDDIELEVLGFRSLYPRWLYPGGDPSDGTSFSPDPPGARVRNVLTWWNPIGWVVAALTLRGDIVHAQWWSFFLAPVYVTVLALARLRGKRVIVTVHNVEPHEGGVFRRLANRAVLPLAHRLIVHTEQNRQTLLTQGVAAERVSIVPHGIRAPIRVDREATRRARRKLGLREHAPVALFLGHLRPYKGVGDLLRAFRRVADELPGARLLIAGQVWGDPAPLRELIDKLGLQDSVRARFEFIPGEAMFDYFAAADVVVYPYAHFDAQSGAACEGLRHGRAVIVTRVGGLPDLVDDPAVIVAPGSADELAQAMLLVLTDSVLRSKLESDSRRKAEGHSWDAVAAATAAVYEPSASERVAAPVATGAER